MAWLTYSKTLCLEMGKGWRAFLTIQSMQKSQAFAVSIDQKERPRKFYHV